MSNTLEQARESLGELFIMGFQGPELSEETQAFITQAGIGGVMVGALNYESPAQMAELSNQAQECRKLKGLPLWIGVDHEGGRVQRLKKHFTRIPDAAAVAAADSPKLAFEIAELMAKELRAVGINLNFAPVADIATNPRNPVIGPRAYGGDEETVSKMTSGIVRGHLVNGVQPCVKHFPGHGDTGTDPHFALPRVDTPLETMRERELKPFLKAIKSRCEIVMTAHMICSRIDPKRPATLSPLLLQDVLRGELRFKGIIITDEMEMKAIADHFGPEDAPRMAIEAGCDILLYKTESGARRAYASLLKDLDEGRLDPARVVESSQRIREIKKGALMPYHPVKVAEVGKLVGIPEHAAIVSKVPELKAK